MRELPCLVIACEKCMVDVCMMNGKCLSHFYVSGINIWRFNGRRPVCLYLHLACLRMLTISSPCCLYIDFRYHHDPA